MLSLVYKPYAAAALIERSGITLTAGKALPEGALTQLLLNFPLIRTSMAGAWKAWLAEAGLSNESLAEKAGRGPVYAQASLATEQPQ